jgi:hypothetical protein
MKPNMTQKKIIGPHINDALTSLIKSSYVLKAKLRSDQIEKFIQRALTLSNNQKLNLLTQLEQEQAKLAEYKPDVKKQLQKLHTWNDFVKNECEQEKKRVFKEGENESNLNDINIEEQLLSDLENQ